MKKLKWTYQRINWKTQGAARADAPSAPSASSIGAAPIATGRGTGSRNAPHLAVSNSSDMAPPPASSIPVAETVTCVDSASAGCWPEGSALRKWAYRRGETVEQALRVILDDLRENYPEKSVWPVEDQVTFYFNQHVIHV